MGRSKSHRLKTGPARRTRRAEVRRRARQAEKDRQRLSLLEETQQGAGDERR